MPVSQLGPERPTVLVVDHEGDTLEQEGFEVLRAHDGGEAIERTREYEPALILLDVMLSKLDGIEVCNRFRTGADIYL